MSRITATIIASLAIAAPAFSADTWTVDAVHSAALFKVQHMGAGFSYGRFNKIAGTVTTDADATKNAVSITIAADSVDTANTQRDDHLKGDAFFNVKQFPEITFVSTAWTAAGADTWTVTGNFTLRGVTKPVTATVRKTGQGKAPPQMGGKDLIGYETSFAIKQTDFGMKYGIPAALSDDVTIILSVEATK
jgi:polyisoprenoid-binding protein YceI